MNLDLFESYVIFSPEFLQEGKVLWNNHYLSRTIVGTDKDDVTLMNSAMKFAKLLTEDMNEHILIKYSLLKNGSTQK